MVGDWDGDGTQALGVVRPSKARDGDHLLLRNGDGSVVDYWFGRSGDHYLAGDWDGDGDFTRGVHRAGTFWLRNSPGSGGSEVRVRFGRRNDLGVVGDWDNRP